MRPSGAPRFSCSRVLSVNTRRRKVKSGLGDLKCTIDVPKLDLSSSSHKDLLEDCRYIGSYDWDPHAKRGHPIIVVPGSPNVWLDPRLPFRLKPDVGLFFRDYNDHILPGQPLLPLLVAVQKQRIFRDEQWKAVDFITDRNGLRKLLWWINGLNENFRIDTQLVGNKTVVLNRWEASNKAWMTGGKPISFGHGFEKTTTRPMPPSSERCRSHHRIITYKFGRLRFVVQCETDACLLQKPATWISAPTGDEFVHAVANMDSSNTERMFTYSSDWHNAAQDQTKIFGVTVRHKGRADILQSSIVEITSGKKSTSRLGLKFPQLYFSQTGSYHVGQHKRGDFRRIHKLLLFSPRLQAAYARVQPALNELEEALGRIQSLVMENRNERLSLVYEQRKLRVYKNRTGLSCFPPEALNLFK